MFELRLRTIHLSISAALALVGCGGSTSSAEDAGLPDAESPDVSNTIDVNAPDAGTTDTGSLDAATTDSPSDAGTDAPDASGPIVASSTLTLWGVTGDGFAVYTDDSTQDLYSVALTGGTPTHLASVASATFYYGFVIGNVAFVFSKLDTMYVGTLTVWSSAGGAHTLSSASRAGAISVSSDSKHIVYSDNVSGAGTGDYYVVNADGSGATLLLGGAAGFNFQTMCPPYAMFGGPSVVTSQCPTVDGGTAASATISVFASPGWTRKDLATDAYPGYFVSDSAGTKVLVGSVSAGLEVLPTAGGSPTVIDATGTGALLTSDGATAVYTTTSGALKRSPLASPQPTTLVPSGVMGLYGLSPDSKSVLVFQNYNPQTYLSDLYLASASTPGTLTTLSSMQTAATASQTGTAFTNDSSHTFFLTGVATQTYVGALNVASTSGGTPSLVGQNSNVGYPAGPSKLVFDANYMMVGNMPATVDILMVDTATSGGPTTLVKGAGGGFAVTAAGDRLVYTSSAMKGGGLYVVPIP